MVERGCIRILMESSVAPSYGKIKREKRQGSIGD
jgi:hypothetical protein